MSTLALSGFVAASQVNGPGERVVIWVQGCSLACPGCFNAHTHEAGPADTPVEAVVERILAERPPMANGVTFSGGEPFQQASALAELGQRLKEVWPEATLMAYSGYTLSELRSAEAPKGSAALLAQLDWLVDGRFQVKNSGEQAYRGSQNQRFWVLGRPLPVEALDAPPNAELHVLNDGRVLLSGFPDARLRRVIAGLKTL